jgi:hypothetical protein
LIFVFGAYSGVAPTIPGFSSKEECLAAGKAAREELKQGVFWCVPGPKQR